MARHVFLTGAKQSGKTTLLKKALARYHGGAGGFVTLRTDAFRKDRCSVHLFPLGEAVLPTEENLLFLCGEENAHTAERFDRLGCAALRRSCGADLIVMDELGPHEAEAAAFRAAVLEALCGGVPVFGVLQAPAAAFWPEIVGCPEAEIVEVSEENRNDEALLWRILSVLEGG